MYKHRIIIISVLVLALLLGLPDMTASAITRLASISFGVFTPNPVAMGGEVAFDLVFSVSDITPGVGGTEIYVGYDPTLVAPSTTPGVGVAEGRPEFFGVSNVSINEALTAANCPGGARPCIHVVVAGPPQVTQTGAGVRFHFRSLAEGSACFAVLQAKMVDSDGYIVTPVTVPSTNPCVPISFSATASGVILRQGVPANPNPALGSLACSRVTATPGAYGPAYTSTVGAFTLGSLPSGTYTFRADYPGYLPSDKTGVVISSANSSTVSLGTTTLRGGDVNGDNVINILDIGNIISKWGQTSAVARSASSPNCSITDESADINDDGSVNISDLAITAGNWGSVGPTLWP
ncbi:MAG: dockerin type I domain-containing protein [Chloroflexi bacterium]|nr:dockerin type I domain-containing protein [Chloroflexota bacterium]